MKNVVLSTWGWENHLRVEKEERRREREQARAHGEEIGITRGKRIGRESVAKKMLMLKTIGDEQIIQLTGISQKRLKELKAQIIKKSPGQ